LGFFDAFLRLFIPSVYLIHPNGSPVRWPSLPARIDLSALEGRFLASANRAVDLWRLDGRPCFLVVSERPQVRVSVGEEGCGMIEEGGGETEWDAPAALPVLVACRVVVCPFVKDELLAAVFVHELGHCLGLAHTSADWSIMQPKAREGVSAPSARDLQNLQRLYR